MEKVKTVIITGVLGGMGKATAKLLLKEQFKIIGLDILDNCDLPISYYKTDLTSEESIRRTYSYIIKEVKKIDAIIHFAGVYRMGSLVEMNEREYTSIFDINLFSIYRINKIFLPLISKKGKIIITSSELAPLWPLPFTGIYAITKSCVEKYAYSLKMELNLLDIYVSIIRPGAVKTNLLNDSVNELERLCENTKLYKYNTKKFKKIVNSVESKHIEPNVIAKKAYKILVSKKPKFIYNINRNKLLKLLNIFPKRFQFFVIKSILKDRRKEQKEDK